MTISRFGPIVCAVAGGCCALGIAAAASPAPTVVAQNARVHVQTPEELEQSFWNRIRDSTDPADFDDYAKQFPAGAHRAEAALLARRLRRGGQGADGGAGGNAAPEASPAQPAAADVPLRFAVAHKHSFSWCYGYLYVARDSVRFEVVQPSSDHGHGFTAKRFEVRASQWSVLGNPLPGVELRVKGQDYIFEWLADEGEVQSGGAHRMAPPLANAPAKLLGAFAPPPPPGFTAPAAVSAPSPHAPSAPVSAAVDAGASASAISTPIPGGVLDGLYLGKKLTVVFGLKYGGTHMDDLFFRFYPNGGFVSFDGGSAAPSPSPPANTADTFYSGTYRVDDTGTIRFRYRGETGEEHSKSLIADAGKLSLGTAVELCTCDGALISGNFDFDGPSISFGTDGRFMDRGVLHSAVAETEAANARPGAGTYRVAANRIFFTYDDGRQISMFFAMLKSASASSAWVKLGSLTANRR